ncbi:hypothetical protein B0H14DRAFT_2614164 [Mycena olivaceomarginata]|nr:hypothetical protein B0H14DRAFT_2614164 [Mycena olivaceomarginata]
MDLIDDFSARLNYFIDSQAYHTRMGFPAFPVIFDFGREYSIVAADYDIAGRKVAVDFRVNSIEDSVASVTGLTFGPRTFYIRPYGVITRLCCFRTLQPTLAPRNMLGELEIFVLPNVSHNANIGVDSGAASKTVIVAQRTFGLQSPKRRLDPASDPDLFTPCKRMRFLGVGLASTSSGSFLVTKPKATHLDIGKIAAPVFERIPDELQKPDWIPNEKTHPLSEEEFGWVRQDAHIGQGKNSAAVGGGIWMRRIWTGQAGCTHWTRKLTSCQEEFGRVRQDAHIGRGENSPTVGGKIWTGHAGCTHWTRRKLTSCRRKNLDGSGRMHTLDEEKLTTCWRKNLDRSGRMHIGRGENSQPVGGRIWTGQAGCTHRTRRKLTSHWRKNLDESGRMHTSDEEKTHPLLEEEFDGSGRMHTSDEEKTHILLEEEFGWVKQDAQIGWGENSHPVRGRIWTGQAGCTHQTRRKLTACWRKNLDGSSRIHRSDEEKTHGLLEDECGQRKNLDRSGRMHTADQEKTHILLEEEFGRVKQDAHRPGETYLLLEEEFRQRKNLDGSGRMHTLDKKTHQLSEEEFRRVRQDAHIGRIENSPTVGGRIWTGQAGCTHWTRRKLTTCWVGQAGCTHRMRRKFTACWRKNLNGSGRMHTSDEGKTLTSYWRKNSDESGRMHTSDQEKTHPLSEEEFGQVRQDAHIGQGENSPAAGGKIWTGQAGYTHRKRRKLTHCRRRNLDGSGRMHTSDKEKTHPLLEEKFG